MRSDYDAKVSLIQLDDKAILAATEVDKLLINDGLKEDQFLVENSRDALDNPSVDIFLKKREDLTIVESAIKKVGIEGYGVEMNSRQSRRFSCR